MADKTASMQPSTPFHDDAAASPATHSLTDPFTSSTAYTSLSINNLISGTNRPNNMERKNQFDISLMSPPESTPHDSFARASPKQSMDTPTKSLYVMPVNRFPISPPVSPPTKNIVTEEGPSLVVRDPILYPTEPQVNASSQAPLFNEDETLVAQRVVNGHVAARGSSLFREASPPRQSEYELALEFKSQVAKAFNVNRARWLERERSYLMEDRATHSGVRRYTTIAPATGIVRQQAKIKSPPKNGVVKNRSQPKTSNPRATPDPNRVKNVAREDKDFNSIQDCCPPVSSLPNKPNSLKVDWRGAPIDLKHDPNAYLLHPDEILLAANLRLDCATYLTSKRRIFVSRINALRIGKEFRKTDAQQACKIDVNKASKLWQAFEKVGWLNPNWVKKYL